MAQRVAYDGRQIELVERNQSHRAPTEIFGSGFFLGKSHLAGVLSGYSYSVFAAAQILIRVAGSRSFWLDSPRWVWRISFPRKAYGQAVCACHGIFFFILYYFPLP